MIQIQKELINFRGKLESINISSRGFPHGLVGNGISVRGTIALGYGKKRDGYECRSFCCSIISKLNDQISSSHHLLYEIDGLLLKSLDMIIPRVLCTQYAAHLKCKRFIFSQDFTCAKQTGL